MVTRWYNVIPGYTLPAVTQTNTYQNALCGITDINEGLNLALFERNTVRIAGNKGPSVESLGFIDNYHRCKELDIPTQKLSHDIPHDSIPHEEFVGNGRLDAKEYNAPIPVKGFVALSREIPVVNNGIAKWVQPYAYGGPNGSVAREYFKALDGKMLVATYLNSEACHRFLSYMAQQGHKPVSELYFFVTDYTKESAFASVIPEKGYFTFNGNFRQMVHEYAKNLAKAGIPIDANHIVEYLTEHELTHMLGISSEKELEATLAEYYAQSGQHDKARIAAHRYYQVEGNYGPEHWAKQLGISGHELEAILAESGLSIGEMESLSAEGLEALLSSKESGHEESQPDNNSDGGGDTENASSEASSE